jgi:hypothetical protein
VRRCHPKRAAQTDSCRARNAAVTDSPQKHAGRNGGWRADFTGMSHFYHAPQTVEEVIDTVVDRILDHLGVETQTQRWRADEMN